MKVKRPLGIRLVGDYLREMVGCGGLAQVGGMLCAGVGHASRAHLPRHRHAFLPLAALLVAAADHATPLQVVWSVDSLKWRDYRRVFGGGASGSRTRR